MKYDKIKIAKEIAKIVGGKPTAFKYHQNEFNIDIFIGKDRPDDFIKTCSTIGLSEYTIYQRIEGKPLRVELIGAADSSLEYFPNIIADCAFNIIRGEYSMEPGAVYPNIIENYYPEATVKHVFFTEPFLWNFKSLDFKEMYVTWLQAIPITEEEFKIIKKYGSEQGKIELENLFERHQIDIYDFMRKSVI